MSNIDLIIKKHLEDTGEKITLIKEIHKSLNGRLYKIKYKNKISILKLYKSEDKIRYHREKESLYILNKNHFEFCPKLFYFNNFYKYLIIEELKANKPIPNNKFKFDLAKYIENQQNYILPIDKNKMMNASEAGFSIFEHLGIVKKKANFILEKLTSQAQTKEACKFISHEIFPWLNSYEEQLRLNDNYFNKIKISEIIFSQSDIGVHNSFINNQKIYTFDYEYAGLDDPAKTICDLLINPDQIINKDDFNIVLEKISTLKIFKNAIDRFRIILPIYRLKWFLIILNGYLKEDKQGSEDSFKILMKAFDYLKNSEEIIQIIKDF
ncbi:hypothetical protein [Prochlorococcus marinus]|uniref:Aminoglycoside phosphotransferase domain-containing protein n=1 Tax=Prochlorococcus marinus (strain AS9601) TaxID=146891 RepID=A2BSH9_PROMS|nr:hypothetical protein [Prochlorococcus marinus]ABM70740.1 conserved hypothetical protein [Prochlorococcus marinus str. AS9601]